MSPITGSVSPERIRQIIENTIIGGENVTITADDLANTLTIDATDQGLVNVREWGVDPHDTAVDPAPAMELALQDLSGTGKLVYLPEGEYRLRSIIRPGAINNTGLFSHSRNAVISGASSFTGSLINLDEPTSDVRLEGFTLDGKYGAGRVSTGLYNLRVGLPDGSTDRHERLLIDRVRSIRQPINAFNVLLKYCRNAVVTRSDIDLGGRDGLHMQNCESMIAGWNHVYLLNLEGAPSGGDVTGDDMMAVSGGDYYLLVGNRLGPAPTFHQGRNIIIGAGGDKTTRFVAVVGNQMSDAYHANVAIEADQAIDSVGTLGGTPGLVEHVGLVGNEYHSAGQNMSAPTNDGDALKIEAGLLVSSSPSPGTVRGVHAHGDRFFTPRRHAVTLATHHASAVVEDVDILDCRGWCDQTQAHVSGFGCGIASPVVAGVIERVTERGNKFIGFPAGAVKLDGGTSALIRDLVAENEQGWKSGKAGSNVPALTFSRIQHLTILGGRGKDRRPTSGAEPNVSHTSYGLWVDKPRGEVVIRGFDGIDTLNERGGGLPILLTLDAGNLPTHLHIDGNPGYDPWFGVISLASLTPSDWDPAGDGFYIALSTVNFTARFPAGKVPCIELSIQGAGSTGTFGANAGTVSETSFTPFLWSTVNTVDPTGELLWRARPRY